MKCTDENCESDFASYAELIEHMNLVHEDYEEKIEVRTFDDQGGIFKHYFNFNLGFN